MRNPPDDRQAMVWRLNRLDPSLADLVVTPRELTEPGVGVVSLTEALDLTAPTGRAMAGDARGFRGSSSKQRIMMAATAVIFYCAYPLI